jgi:hypothetical protein
LIKLLKHWATIFKHEPDFKSIDHLYTELRQKGIDFPVYDPESMPLPISPTRELNTGPLSQQAGATGGGDGVSPNQRQTTNQTMSPPSKYQRIPELQMNGIAVKVILYINYSLKQFIS